MARKKVEAEQESVLVEDDLVEEADLTNGEAGLDYDRTRQKINIGLHPLGGVILDVTDAYNRNAVVQLEPQLLGQLVMNLITLNVVFAQQQAQLQQEEMEKISKIWKPS